jgi:hypothetical protein
MSIWQMTGAELSEACADITPRYPSASPALAAVLTGITALSAADQRALMTAFRKAEPAKQARLSGSAFRCWDDFHPAWRAAVTRAREELGPRWDLDLSTLNARVPGAWVRIKLSTGATIAGPRDIHIPAPRFWPGGVLPCGPEYAERGPLEPARVVVRLRREKAPEFAMEPTPEWVDDLAEAAD